MGYLYLLPLTINITDGVLVIGRAVGLIGAKRPAWTRHSLLPARLVSGVDGPEAAVSSW